MKKPLKLILLGAACLLLLVGAGIFRYLSDYYRADVAALAAVETAAVRTDGNLTILRPDVPGDTGLIFYPGGKVEHTAYLPLLEQLRQQGITCVLVEMPFRLAVFSPGAADQVFAALPDISRWYIGGHSLGGAMAGSYAADHPDRIRGLILLGAYRYGSFPLSHTLTLYGTEDGVMDRSKLDYTEHVVPISGGNHAQFGNYGPQEGDGVATIPPQEQQAIAVQEILAFLAELEQVDSANAAG